MRGEVRYAQVSATVPLPFRHRARHHSITIADRCRRRGDQPKKAIFVCPSEACPSEDGHGCFGTGLRRFLHHVERRRRRRRQRRWRRGGLPACRGENHDSRMQRALQADASMRRMSTRRNELFEASDGSASATLDCRPPCQGTAQGEGSGYVKLSSDSSRESLPFPWREAPRGRKESVDPSRL